ncbi:MAG: hypothetical protein OEV43_09370, partial [Coriobacteriia bacterium]|nr:hypothetical protein [Coriobacteriia bacterium]
EIFTWTQSGGTEQLTENTYEDEGALTSGDRVVWNSWGGSIGEDREIFTWTAGGGAPVRLTDNDDHDFNPKISGDRIAWYGPGGSDSGPDYEVFTWTPAGGIHQVTVDANNAYNPRVSGDRIVYYSSPPGESAQVFMWTPTGGVVPVSSADTPPDMYPDVSGSRIVWYTYDGSSDASEIFTAKVLTATLMPVHRFYNVKTGVHFYTASESEKASVIANLGHIFHYEGVSYQINTSNPVNSQWLHRFYNAKAGVHFYTASESEKASVIANLGHIYTYEGPAYKVSTTPTPKPVWRFYNFKKGVHFYTADPNEKNNVLATLGWTYSLDGIGYHIGQ